MSDPQDATEHKKLKDFSGLVSTEVPKHVKAASADPTQLPRSLEHLLALEKKTRLAADLPSTKTVASAILQLCYDCKQWQLLNDHITLLCKRRAQLTKVQATVVQMGAKWIETMPSNDTKRKLIDTLRKVSEGKMFVELERAQMTRTLAHMLEAEGKITEAGDVLQDVQVETIGSMEIREKADFLLEQVRLMLAKRDYVRAAIISRKVDTKILAKEDLQDLKLKFNNLMVEYHTHEKDYLAICRCYLAMFNTQVVQDDPAQWQDALVRTVMFLVLSEFDSEVSELLAIVKAEKKLQEDAVGPAKAVIDLFTTPELMRWPLPVDAAWRSHPVFSDANEGKTRLEVLERRVVQHNIRTVAKYYHRIRTRRLADLLHLSEERAEKELSDMVSSKQLFCKIDRPAGIATFTPRETPSSMLNDWAGDISQLLGLVEKTCHLIHKENMVHGVA